MKRCFSLFLAVFLSVFIFSACGSVTTPPDTVTLACTTYPVYLLAQAMTEGVDGVESLLVIDQQVSCLHDYTLTMRDMKAIDHADLLIINGGGMEEFLEDILENREVLDCSEGLPLAMNEEEGEPDAHIWLDTALYSGMAENMAKGLEEIDPDHADLYGKNVQIIQNRLDILHSELNDVLSTLNCRELITFHDGFRYFAHSFGLEIAASVEEEEGSEASARRIVELTDLIDEYSIPAVFTEVNGSDSTAIALSYERGTKVAALNLGMSRDSVSPSLSGLDAYEFILRGNVETILNNYQGERYGEK